jgi:hypothetical protein
MWAFFIISNTNPASHTPAVSASVFVKKVIAMVRSLNLRPFSTDAAFCALATSA